MKLTREELMEYRRLTKDIVPAVHEAITEILVEMPGLVYVADEWDFKVHTQYHDNGHDCWGKSEYYTTCFVIGKDGVRYSVYNETLIAVDKDDYVIKTLYGLDKNKLQEAKQAIIDWKKKQLDDFVESLPG